MNNIKLPLSFKSDSPILENVNIIDSWFYYDGPLYGICEIQGVQFFFCDIVYDIWRHYEDGSHELAWRIYTVYDINIDRITELTDKQNGRIHWQNDLDDESNIIGIFWG